MKSFVSFLTFALLLFLVPAALTACSSAPTESDVGSLQQRVCANGGLTSDAPTNTITPGTIVHWTATASCALANPEYAFFFRDPSGTITQVQAYSTTSTYTWTVPATPGIYDWIVWIREAGSNPTPPWETYQSIPVRVGSDANCTAGTVSASPGSPQAIGTPVTLTGGSATCGSPLYQFYIAPPGGSYTLTQAYSATPTLAWTPSVVGAYSIMVWVKSAASLRQYDTYGFMYFNALGSVACSAGSISAAPVSPSALGTQIAVTAGSSGCASPQYQFWLQSPGGSYSIVQPYGSSSVYNWDTSSFGSGTYSFMVWVRSATSTAAYETYRQMYYALTFSATTSAQPISAGLFHTCTRRTDGTVNCWGMNTEGEIGDGTTTNAASPVAVSGLSGVTAVQSGYYHSCAISGGAVSCWGGGTSGQLGNGSFSGSSSTPLVVPGISTAIGLATGAAHTCVVLSDGTARCWGYSSQGAIGNGGISSSATPVTVNGLSGAVAIAAGYYYSCALKSDGTVVCWGGNSHGELGNGSVVNSPTPVTVSGLKDVRSISANAAHTCAVLSDRTVKCWGQNTSGQNGNGTTTDNLTPVAVTGLSGVASVSLGPDVGCAVLTDGTARCWGVNANGGLGNGNTTSSTTPVVVTGLSGVAAITPGWRHTCALLTDNSEQCWGFGPQGELGDGNATSSLTPVVVALP